MASPAFDSDAFSTAAFDTNAFDVVEVGPTPTVGTGFSRLRAAAVARKNADYVNRRA